MYFLWSYDTCNNRPDLIVSLTDIIIQMFFPTEFAHLRMTPWIFSVVREWTIDVITMRFIAIIHSITWKEVSHDKLQ